MEELQGRKGANRKQKELREEEAHLKFLLKQITVPTISTSARITNEKEHEVTASGTRSR